jgi:HPt (histidine-containing phosphotransfer) domain-containing protein
MESTINPTFKNKLQKVLQLNLDSEDTLLAFNDLSSFYDNNTIDSRWNLCAQLEKRCITVNEEFLQAFSQIQKELAKVQESVDDLQNACTTMEQKIASTKSVSGKLIEQADKLFTAK